MRFYFSSRVGIKVSILKILAFFIKMVLKAREVVLKDIYICLWRQPNTPGRALPGGASLTTKPPSRPADLGDPWRRQKTTIHLCSLWGQGQQAPDYTGCEEALWHWRGYGQNSDQAWWREEGVCSAGSWLWCFGCCQQNWDHLNWVQLANFKYKSFHYIFKKKKNNNNKYYCFISWLF